MPKIAQWGYIHFQVGVAKYNAIYGTLALLPIFMVWIYTSWLIVLFGVEVVSAHQNIRTFRREFRTPHRPGCLIVRKRKCFRQRGQLAHFNHTRRSCR